MNALAIDTLYPHLDATIVEQQHIAGRDIAGQRLVIETDLALVTGIALKIGVEHEAVAVFEFDRAGGKARNTDFGSLQVAQHRHFTTEAARAIARALRPQLVIFGTAMRKIEPHDINAGSQHRVQAVGLIASGS